MFAQVIRAEVTDRDAVRAAGRQWLSELAPSAAGWLGATTGVSEDGRLFVMALFDSEGSARQNSARPEQTRWWADFSRLLTGEATFYDSNNVVVHAPGDIAAAGFVQVISGRTSDMNRSRELMVHMEALDSWRPDILGTVSVGHADGDFTHVIYFTSEAEARAAEARLNEEGAVPPELQALGAELMSLGVGAPSYLDLTDPVVDSPA